MPSEDVIKGEVKQAEGKVQNAVGNVTDNPDDNIAGKAKQAEGKIQEGFGRVKDAVKDTLDK